MPRARAADRDEPRRCRWLRREDRQPRVHLHRVGRDDVGRDSLGDRLGDPRSSPLAVGPKSASTLPVIAAGATPGRLRPGRREAFCVTRLRSARRRSLRLGVPVKMTVVLRRVRPRRKAGSVSRDGPSTSTSSALPIRSWLRSCATRCTTSTSRSIRSCLISSGTAPPCRTASVPWRGEYTNVNAPSKPTSSTTSIVSRKSSSVSPGKPTMMSVVNGQIGGSSRASPLRAARSARANTCGA